MTSESKESPATTLYVTDKALALAVHVLDVLRGYDPSLKLDALRHVQMIVEDEARKS